MIPVATDPAIQIWIDAFQNFGKALRECGAKASAIFNSLHHSPEAHIAIRDELTACVLGARKRPELEGDFAEPGEM